MTHPRYRTRAWAAARKQTLERDSHRCRLRCSPGCLERANSVDHTVRPEDGGAEYDLTNLVSCCIPCNTAKRNQQLAQRAKGTTGASRTW